MRSEVRTSCCSGNEQEQQTGVLLCSHRAKGVFQEVPTHSQAKQGCCQPPPHCRLTGSGGADTMLYSLSPRLWDLLVVFMESVSGLNCKLGFAPHLSFSQHLCTSLKEKKAGAREGTPHGSQAPWLPETAGAAEPEQLALELQELPVCPGSTLTPL